MIYEQYKEVVYNPDGTVRETREEYTQHPRSNRINLNQALTPTQEKDIAKQTYSPLQIYLIFAVVVVLFVIATDFLNSYTTRNSQQQQLIIAEIAAFSIGEKISLEEFKERLHKKYDGLDWSGLEDLLQGQHSCSIIQDRAGRWLSCVSPHYQHQAQQL